MFNCVDVFAKPWPCAGYKTLKAPVASVVGISLKYVYHGVPVSNNIHCVKFFNVVFRR